MEAGILSARQKNAWEYIKEKESVALEELCSALNMSESTARRILATLEQQGLVQRFRGGAMLPVQHFPEPPVLRRLQEMPAEKRAIAKGALAYIHDGDTILLTSGTTVSKICPLLSAFSDLTVLTDSLLVHTELAQMKNVQLVLLGGMMNADEQCVNGFLTLENAARFKIDVMFTSAKALSIAQGFMTDDIEHMMLYRRLMEMSGCVVALADNHKLHLYGKAVIYSFSEIDHLLIDNNTPKPLVKALQDNGAPVLLCPVL